MKKIFSLCILILFVTHFVVNGQKIMSDKFSDSTIIKGNYIKDVKDENAEDSLFYYSILNLDTINFKPNPILSDTSFFGKKYEVFVDTVYHDDSSITVSTYLNDFEFLLENRSRTCGKEYYTFSEISNKRNGVFKNFHTNGNLRSIEIFVYDIEVGDWLEYYPNGKLKSIKVYGFEYSDFFLPPREITREKVSASYQECCDSIEFLGPVKMPKRAEYFYENGFIERIEYYKNRKKDGLWKYFSINGRLIKEESYKLDVLIKTKLY